MNRLYGIENCPVITPYYGLDFTAEESVQKIEKSICFVGQMGREENHLAAMRLIRLFKETGRNDYTLTFIGAHPKEELQKEAADNIRITGFVDDINAEIRKHEFAVFPLTLGAGIKFKVLLALGLGLPVITTSVGAEAIDEEGKVLLLAESDDEILKAMKKLMDDREYLERISEESHQFVIDHFSWERTEKLFADIYR